MKTIQQLEKFIVKEVQPELVENGEEPEWF
jgi:hypothetical protein